jgi:dTDP-4-amino-4,6-dideoxygalactose transaminase
MTEWQARILLAQMTRFREQDKIRTENAAYLAKLLNEIPGIYPAKPYSASTYVSHHLCMFRFDPAGFAGMTRARFMEAMRAEGFSVGTGYGRLDRDDYVLALAKNPYYLKIYGEKTMKQWLERIKCPQNEKLTDQALWIGQTALLAPKQNMDQIAEAMRKIQKNAKELKG